MHSKPCCAKRHRTKKLRRIKSTPQPPWIKCELSQPSLYPQNLTRWERERERDETGEIRTARTRTHAKQHGHKCGFGALRGVRELSSHKAKREGGKKERRKTMRGVVRWWGWEENKTTAPCCAPPATRCGKRFFDRFCRLPPHTAPGSRLSSPLLLWSTG